MGRIVEYCHLFSQRARPELFDVLNVRLIVVSVSISSVKPFCLIEDLDSNVLDIGIAMVTPMPSAEVLWIHQERGIEICLRFGATDTRIPR